MIKQDDKSKFTDKIAKLIKKIERNKYFSVYLNSFDKHSLQLLKYFKKKFDFQFLHLKIKMDHNFTKKDFERMKNALTDTKNYGFLSGKAV